jgi:hypothetical protein
MPVQLLTPRQIVEKQETLSFGELVELNEATQHTRGDEAYIVAASEWFTERSKQDEYSRRGRNEPRKTRSANR